MERLLRDAIDGIDVYKQNHVRIRADGRTVHIDPFMVGTEIKDADYILITHDHYDHFSVRDIAKTAKESTVLVVPEAIKKKAEAAEGLVERIVTVTPGNVYDIGGLSLETVPAYNIGKPFHPKGAGWVGYILNLGGARIYIAGDTDATKEAEAVTCDIALVPIGGIYTMNPKQAADLVNTIRPGIAVPVHYGEIVGREKDGVKFENAVGKDIQVVFKIPFGKPV